MLQYRYVGCFFQYDYFIDMLNNNLSIHRNHLDNIIKNPHVTFEYEPKQVNETLFGYEIQVKIIGYGNNGKNEGLLVKLYSNNATINKMIRKIKRPHITLSISQEGTAVETKNLDFELLSDPIEILGTYGGFTQEKNTIISHATTP